MIRPLVPLLAGAALLVAAPAQAATPKPADSPKTFAKRLTRALTTKKCPGLKGINAVSEIQLACPRSSAAAKKEWRKFKVLGTRAYGTGIVVDFKSAGHPKGATFVGALGLDRKWSLISQVDVGRRTSNKKGPSDRASQGAVLDRFLVAVRDGNCDEYFATADTGQLAKEEACRQAFEAPNGFYLPLQESIRGNPDAKPGYIGGNPVFQFLAYPAGDVYRTAILVKTRAGAPTPWLVLATVRV
jgi:hypothetical protein